MARKQVLVQLDDGMVGSLDRRARAARISRSELIRAAIAAHLRDLEWEEADRAAVKAYRRSAENAKHLPALDRLSAEVFGDEDWTES